MKVHIRSAGHQYTKGKIMILETKNYGKIKIIGDGHKYGYLEVEFLSTGHRDEFRKDAVLKGEIRDKFAVSLFDVGIIGDIKTRGKYKKAYTLWRNMLHRCYHSDNKAYQGVVTVCERWKTFQYFYEDMCLIEGWDAEAFESGSLVLDKDIKQRFSKNKIYSVDTCSWVTNSVNNPIQDRQQHRFRAKSPDGEIYEDTNITDFARKHNLERKQISAVLHGRFRSTEGWTFEYINDEEIV